jgi:hypothetical protein
MTLLFKNCFYENCDFNIYPYPKLFLNFVLLKSITTMASSRQSCQQIVWENFVFGQKFCFRTKILFSDKNFVFGQKFCFRTKILFSDKNFVFGQNFCFRTKLLFSDKKFAPPTREPFRLITSCVGSSISGFEDLWGIWGRENGKMATAPAAADQWAIAETLVCKPRSFYDHKQKWR